MTFYFTVTAGDNIQTKTGLFVSQNGDLRLMDYGYQSGDGDIAPSLIERQGVDRALIRPSWDLCEKVLDRAIGIMSPLSGSKISSLSELYRAMVEGRADVLDIHGCWRSDLPSFGGEAPSDTAGIWSWDEESMIVGSCADDLQIEGRYYPDTAAIVAITVLSDEDRTFSILSDWNEDRIEGQNWPSDDEVRARLEQEIGRSVKAIVFSDGGDHPVYSEAIYTWIEA